jgi:menaquinone-dependent protoporphyrinogen oxidase
MNVLVVFATLEGQTRKVARFVEQELVSAGHDVVLFDTAQKAEHVSFQGVDKVILAGSVHERRHPVTFEVFLAAHRHDLQPRDTLLLSVSLSAAFKEGLEDASDYVTEMEMRTRFRPDSEALVAGAVKTGEYDYFASQVLRHVVLRGRAYDPADGEHEFTDWPQLAGTLSQFMAAENKSAPLTSEA